jgi:hypothetical protein
MAAAARPPITWLAALLAVGLFVVVGFIAGAEPKFGIAAALAIVYALVVFTNLSAALTVLVVVVFAESTPLAGPALSATKIAGLLLALGWLARVATDAADRRVVLFSAHPALSYLLALFIAWIGLSIIWAQDVALALDRSMVFLLVAILYVIVFTAVQTRRQAMWVIGAFVVGTTITAAYGLVLRPDPSNQAAERLASTIQDPNFLAAILVAGLVLGGAGFFAARGNRLLQLGALTAVTLAFAAFVLTGSRGGIVGLGVALIAAVAFGGRWRLRIALAATVVSVLAVGYYTMLAPPLLRDRILTATEGEVSRADTRSTIWTVATIRSAASGSATSRPARSTTSSSPAPPTGPIASSTTPGSLTIRSSVRSPRSASSGSRSSCPSSSSRSPARSRPCAASCATGTGRWRSSPGACSSP